MWAACLAVLLLAACLPVHRLDAPGVEARDVSFHSAGYRLVGTLTSPGRRPIDAGILIVPGSGPIDRDGASRTATSTPPVYRRWAEGLGADVAAFDQEAQIVDALSAVAFLRSAPEVAGRPIVIIGHSEGGTLALSSPSEPVASPG